MTTRASKTLQGRYKYKVPHFDAKGEVDAIFAVEAAPTSYLEHFSQLYSEPIAGVADVVPTFGRRVECESRGDEGGDLIEGTRPRRSQEGFQCGEREFDRVEVRTVRWEKAELGASRRDSRPDLRLFVHGQVIEDDDVAGAQRGHQHLLAVGQKTGMVEGPSNTAGALSPSGRNPTMTVWVCQCPPGV